MKLYDVVFTNDKVTNLNFVETASSGNAKYKSIYIENDLTKQRYFLSKDVIRGIIKSRKDKSKETYPNIMECVKTESGHDYFGDVVDNTEVVCSIYDFKGLVKTEDIRNYNVVLDNESENSDDSNLLSIAIDTDAYQFIDYEFASRIIQTGKRNGFVTCLIDIPEFEQPNETTLMYAIGIMLRPINDYNTIVRYNIIISSSGLEVYRYNLEFADPIKYIEYIDIISENNKYYKSFKVSDVSGIGTEVVLVNPKFVKENEDGSKYVPDLNNTIQEGITVALIPCTEDMINSTDIDESLAEVILNKNVRVITTFGVKLNPEFYKRYKILYAYSYNPKTSISKCVKSN